MAAKRLQQLKVILQQCPLSTLSPKHDLIQVTPRVSRFDQEVHIKIQSLPSRAKVTVQAWTEHEWQRKRVQFVSCGHYQASEAGHVDLHIDSCLGGTYTGVEPMGLFWSLRPNPLGPHNMRMVVKNVEQPVVYQLSVFLGHLTLAELCEDGGSHQSLSSMTLKRTVIGEGVQRLPVKEGTVRGTLFLPPGKGPFAGIVDMFGFAGGLMEIRAAMLAHYGFAVLALPIYRFDDLPKSLLNQSFDYFKNAVQWMASHASVRQGGVGIIGISGGAALANMMAYTCPQVKAVVLISLHGYHCMLPMEHEGRQFSIGMRNDPQKHVMSDEGLILKDSWVLDDTHMVPLWQKDVQVLTLACDNDGQAQTNTQDKFYQMYPKDRQHLIQLVHYPRAGHLLEPPYTPLCRVCYNPYFDCDLFWGGHTKEHADAQCDSWQRIQLFFHQYLP